MMKSPLTALQGQRMHAWPALSLAALACLLSLSCGVPAGRNLGGAESIRADGASGTVAQSDIARQDEEIPEEELQVTAPSELELGEITEVDLATFFPLQETGQAYVIDARPGMAYREGHVPGAINVPFAEASQRLAELDSELDSAQEAGKVIIVYCTGEDCTDAYRVALQIANLGIDVSVYLAGWDEWNETGLPVDQG